MSVYGKYITVMFPYPSGSGLHCGHWYNYAIVDSYCNYQRYIGNTVYQPFGYDSFGLPAENYAKSVNRDPKEITYENIDKFRQEMKRMNTQFSEVLVTSDESYQKWTKWLFSKLYENNLAYKKYGAVNYCSSCNTVLANEQVKEGVCERCSTVIQVKKMNQWYLRITEYKNRLIKDLDNVDYPAKTKKQQIYWLTNLQDWCVSRQRKWGCQIPINGEEDTLDTFFDSSFYTIRYCDPNNNNSLCDYSKSRPVDLYVGGNEHACMHLIYARFITKFLFDKEYISFDEPFKKVIHQGMILNNGEKMSKSKNNTVCLDGYDSDEIRFYLMFIGNYFDGGSWDDRNINGIKRFINKLKAWLSNTGEEEIDLADFQQTIFSYTEAFKFNKVVSSFMILVNQNKHKRLSVECKNKIVSLLKIYMPNIESKII